MDQQWTNCYREKGFHASYYFPSSSLCLRLNHIKIHHVHGTTCLFFFRFFRFSLLFACYSILLYRRRVRPNESVCAWAFILWSAICIL